MDFCPLYPRPIDFLVMIKVNAWWTLSNFVHQTSVGEESKSQSLAVPKREKNSIVQKSNLRRVAWDFPFIAFGLLIWYRLFASSPAVIPQPRQLFKDCWDSKFCLRSLACSESVLLGNANYRQVTEPPWWILSLPRGYLSLPNHEYGSAYIFQKPEATYFKVAQTGFNNLEGMC